MGVCDIPVISSVCDVAGEAAATLISAPFDWLASAMGEAAAWLFEAVWTVFDTTTLVDVTSGEYLGVYNLIFGIAVFVMLLFFCLQLITGMIRREPAALSRAALGLAKSVLGSFVVITLVALLLEITDQLAIGIIQAAGETTATMGDKIAILVAGLTALNVGAPGVGAILTIFLASLAIAAAAIVWLSLLIRKALLLVAVVSRPVCVLRCLLGCHARLDLQVGDVRHRARVVQAGACRDSAGRGDPGVGPNRRRPVEHRRPTRRGRTDGAGRVRAVHDLPVPVVRRFRSLQLDGNRAGGQERP